MNTLQKFEAKQLAQYQEQSAYPEFSAGDTVRVNVKIREGTRERVQAFEGVCISKSGGGINAKFTVRKISYGEGVERVFPLFSPRIESIDLIRRGSVRRAKLYYLRDLRGKSARIVERTSGHGIETKVDDRQTKAAARKLRKDERQAARAAKKAAPKPVKKSKATKAAEAAAVPEAQENSES